MSEDLLSKKCRNCGEWKVKAEFPVAKFNADGRKNTCKVCTRAYNTERSARLGKRSVIDVPQEKQCAHCREVKPASKFHRTRLSLSGLTSYCKQCAAAKAAASYAADPVKYANRRTAQKLKLCSPESRNARRRSARLHYMRAVIAVAMCRELGVDLDKLAQEKYNAEFGTNT